MYVCTKGFFMELNQNYLDYFVFKLKKEKYKNIIQELKLEYCTEEDKPYIKLVLIKIKKSQQNKGYGNAVMSEIVNLADEHNVQIKLWVTNIFGSDLKRLYSFYRKHKFVLIKTENDGQMIYNPKKK